MTAKIESGRDTLGCATCPKVQDLQLLGVTLRHEGDDLGLREWRGEIGDGSVCANWNRLRGYQLSVHLNTGIGSQVMICAYGADFDGTATKLIALVRTARAGILSLDCSDLRTRTTIAAEQDEHGALCFCAPCCMGTQTDTDVQ